MKKIMVISLLNSAFIQQILGAILFVIIWVVFGIWANATEHIIFQEFAINPTLDAFARLLKNGSLLQAVGDSLWRVFWGIFYAVVLGVPLGILTGLNNTVRNISLMPIQFFRMTSPLSLMPIVILVIPTWDAGIVFLLAFASIWAPSIRK